MAARLLFRCQRLRRAATPATRQVAGLTPEGVMKMFALTHRVVVGLMIGVLGIVAAVAGVPSQGSVEEQAALRVFEERIGAYGALHRRLEGPLPSPKASQSLRSLLISRAFLGSAIKTARPNARQGDIFTPAVEQLFRRIIKEAFEGRDREAFLGDLNDEHVTLHDFHPRVHDPYPDWATHEMPMILLHRLPSLPEDIEYRLLGHDLVLWDIHADLIVDVLPDAIARPSHQPLVPS